MKKKSISIIYIFIVFCMVLSACLLVACEKQEIPQSAKIYTEHDSIRIDRASEQFNVLTGVTAICNDNDITDQIVVECSDKSVIIENGIAEFQRCGDYEFSYSLNAEKYIAECVTVTVSVRNVYSVYLTNATLPPLYCALDMASNNYKFIWFNDRGTVDTSVYGERAVCSTWLGYTDEFNISCDKFYELYQNDPYSYFRLFIPDARNQILLKTVIENEIPRERYEVKYLSDGSMSYTLSFPYRDENAFDAWQTNVEIYDKMIELAKNDNELSFNGVTLDDSYDAYELHAAYIRAAQQDNAEWWGAFPETLVSLDTKVNAEIEKAHLIKKLPENMWADLSDEQKRNFLDSVSFDKESFDQTYFAKSGKYLIVTGTNPYTGSFTAVEFLNVLDKIVTDYPNYNILFKPHPASVPTPPGFNQSDGVYEYMVEHDIAILPGRLPMEVISWVYGDALIGGFDSSLYMSVPGKNVAFFIAENSESLSVVTKTLYDSGMFDNIKFYWGDEV